MALKIERRPVYESTRPVGTRLGWQYVEAIDQLAKKAGVRRSTLVRRIVESHIDQQGASNDTPSEAA